MRKEYTTVHKLDLSDHEKDIPWQTGYFRDGIRRVDMVLVMKGSRSCDVQKLQMNYMTNLLRAGLEVELEPSVDNKYLLFAKLHAPASVIQEYGTYFDVRKHFKAHHMQYMHQGVIAELDFITIARDQYPKTPPGYSTLERSTIVYRMLRVLPFGGDIYIYGLDRMLRDQILVDAYPLHDGPFFLLPGQLESTATARQSLYYTWVGFDNLYKGQPKHLIREYFGERLAFMFAFWESLLKLLAILSVISAAGFGIGMFYYDNNHGIVNDSFKPDSYKLYEKMCPKCRDFVACSNKDLYSLRYEVYLKNRLDSPSCLIASMLAAIVGWVFFFRCWKNEERYMWIWEIPRDCSRNTRPEYHLNEENHSYAPMGRAIAATLVRGVIIMAAVAFVVFVIIVLTLIQYALMRYTTDLILDNQRNNDSNAYVKAYTISYYLILMGVGVVNGIMTITLDGPYRWIAFKLSDWANHRTEEDYEWSVVFKWTGFSVLINFSLFYFFGVVKGFFFTPDKALFSLLFGAMNCGYMGCFDELFVVVLATAATRHCFLEVVQMFRIEPTDYGAWGNLPCWEREFHLQRIDENTVMNIFHGLVMRYMHSTLLMSVIPLAPLVNFAQLLWDIRREARRCLLTCRRPLLTKCHGLGVWSWILALLPLSIALSNDPATTNEYCYYYGHYNDVGQQRTMYSWYKDENITEIMKDIKDYAGSSVKYYIHFQQALLIFTVMGLVSVTGALFWYLYWEEDEPSDIQERQGLEHLLRSYTIEVEELKKNE